MQLGPPAYEGGQGVPDGAIPFDQYGSEPLPSGSGSLYGMTRVDRVFAPRVNIDSRGGSLYGYDAGYSNIGVFVPYKIEDNALVFVHGMGMVTYDSRGGGTVGTGWRYYMEGIDRIAGLSVWFDFDNGHAKPYQQVGLSFESLGRYVDYRVNGYIPFSNADHVLYSQLSPQAVLYGSGIGLIRNNTVEQSYTGLDAETGGPMPYLGRYGLNAYIGAYYFTGNGYKGGNFTGVSGRFMAQINEDVQFGVQVTNDHVFGLNTQFQVFMNLPDGKPGRWLRNLRVHDRMVQNVFRQNRVMAKVDSYQTIDVAINPETNAPYFVANIDPNLGFGGNGQITNPFNSIAQYESLTEAQRRQYDIVLVRPRTDSSNTNLDTASTMELFDGQRLLSTSVAHSFTTANLPGQNLVLPGFTGGSAPKLFNSSGGDVITLVGGNTRMIEVSGFDIDGSGTGNGIRGNNNRAVNINRNNIHDGLNGVLLTNLSGSIADGAESQFLANTVTNNVSNGISVLNTGSPPFVPPLDVIVQGNEFTSNGNDGLRLEARAGATIGGIIGGTNVAATDTTPAITRSNTFDSNGGNGLNLLANGGTLLFKSPPVTPVPNAPPYIPQFGVPNDAYGIYNNIFTNNTLDGLHIETTNNSIARINVTNNSFGLDSSTTSGNKRYGLGLLSDSGVTEISIGGALIENPDGTFYNPGNTFDYNSVSAINLAVGGTAALSYDIINNTITNGATSTVAAPRDSFEFFFNGTSGSSPFTITNKSDPGIEITSVIWNLAGTPATIAATGQGPNGTVNPVVLQPISDSLLTSLNGLAVTPGSSPLLITGLNAPATNANSGMAAGSQLIPLGFTDFDPNEVFSATARLELASGSSPLTSAATNGSSITVNFSNGLSSTQRVTQLNTTSDAVSATGDVFGASIPGFGNGQDGIHIASSGASVVNSANILNNTVTGYGGYGIRVETSGTSTSNNLLIRNNEISNNGTGITGAGISAFTGGGLALERHDSSTLNAIIDANIISSNFNDGISLRSDGTSTGGMTVVSRDNDVLNNAGNGLQISTGGNARLNFTSQRDDYSGNGAGSGNNIDTTGGDNMAFVSNGNSVLDVTLQNVFSNSSSSTGQTSNGALTGNGLSGTTNDSSTLNLLVTGSSLSNNRLNGIVLNSNGRSYMHASIYDTLMNSNNENGILFNRSSASLVRANIVNSSMQANLVNGFNFHGLGSDPQDPNQMFAGPNRINLIQSSLNNNGINGVGQGARVDLLGDSQLVLNATATTFNNNAQNGLRVDITPGAEFGYSLGGERSTFDNVSFNNNGSNGIFVTSEITRTQPGNPWMPYDAPSRTYMQVSANTGSSTISNNGLNGILAQYTGGSHDILVTGDTLNATPQFGTFIQSNGEDGIHSEAGIAADVTLGVDGVIVGGPTVADGNGGDGIDFQVQSTMRIVDGATTEDWIFNAAGVGTLNVDNSLIQNNSGHGISLVGNALAFNGYNPDGTFATRIQNNQGDGWGQLNASITNSSIVENQLNGVNIDLQGRLGLRGAENAITLSGNNISNNAGFGVFLEQNAALQYRGSGTVNDLFRVVEFFGPQPTDPETPFNPNDLINRAFDWNTGDNAPIFNSGVMSGFMNLITYNNTNLVMTDNTIQFNGRGGDLQAGDGVFLRVSTNSYLGADIRNNNMTGNLANDLHIESFLAYNPATGVAPQPTGSVANTDDPDIVVLDDTAQMDLRFTGNIGNTINIVNPSVNGATNGSLPGNTTPNGAYYQADPLKSNFGYLNPNPRLVQLFQVENGPALNSTNFFNQNGTTQNLVDEFYFSSWFISDGPSPVFPNPDFPQTYYEQAGNPFTGTPMFP
ncbi:beta strand repeat-containing protein [Schlesneria sp. T3-172]|uniref:beta strand repeat-containing protein n=1 Tax=Schlesneria sphaerica TaxID=3373610 RepID=UPI0037CA33DE